MRLLAGWVLLLGFWVQVADAADAGDKQQISIRRDPAGHAWQLQANQAAMPSILEELRRVSGITIHYSVLPQEMVSATCVADKLPALLRCLLGQSAGLVFDNANTSAPKEVWILGSTAAQAPDCGASVTAVRQAVAAEETDIAKLNAEVSSTDPQRRGSALYALALVDDKQVDTSLRNGMSDDSALVRGQALGAWVRRYGVESADAELQRAIQDADAAVRMQAIELSADPVLLSQGLQDSDAMVRQLAKAKLDELAH